MLLIAVSYRRCGRNLRAELDTAINSLSVNHAYVKTLYRFAVDKSIGFVTDIDYTVVYSCVVNSTYHH